MRKTAIAKDYKANLIIGKDKEWSTSWYPPLDVPVGTPHGSVGICITENSEIVLISADGNTWDFPAGRPEGNETWEETLRREIREEACATVLDARLLGFSRGSCIKGPEKGMVLIRSFWLAKVKLDEWEPRHEISHRKIVSAISALSIISSVFEPIYHRALKEAGLL